MVSDVNFQAKHKLNIFFRKFTEAIVSIVHIECI